MLVYQVSWIPVIVGALAMMAVGFLWFSMPMFGRPWMRETGKTMEQIKQGSNTGLYVAAVIGALLSSYGMAFLIENAFLETITDAVLLAILVWFVFFAVPTYTNFSFEGRSKLLLLIYVGHQLVNFILLAGIYYAWPA